MAVDTEIPADSSEKTQAGLSKDSKPVLSAAELVELESQVFCIMHGVGSRCREQYDEDDDEDDLIWLRDCGPF